MVIKLFPQRNPRKMTENSWKTFQEECRIKSQKPERNSLRKQKFQHKLPKNSWEKVQKKTRKTQGDIFENTLKKIMEKLLY